MADYDLLHDGEEIDACVDEVVAARGTSASLSAGIAAAVAAETAARETADDSLIGAVGILSNAGQKNLLCMGFTDRTSAPTVTKTADSTGFVVDGNRTSSSSTVLVYDLVNGASSGLQTRYTLPAGKYKVSGTGNAKLFIQVVAHDGSANNVLVSASTEREFEYTAELKATYPYIAFRLATDGNASYDNLTVYPMIRHSEITDSSFQPYAPTNRELYEMILALQSGRSVQSVSQLNLSEQIETEPDEPEEEPEER